MTCAPPSTRIGPTPREARGAEPLYHDHRHLVHLHRRDFALCRVQLRQGPRSEPAALSRGPTGREVGTRLRRSPQRPRDLPVVRCGGDRGAYGRRSEPDRGRPRGRLHPDPHRAHGGLYFRPPAFALRGVRHRPAGRAGDFRLAAIPAESWALFLARRRRALPVQPGDGRSAAISPATAAASSSVRAGSAG